MEITLLRDVLALVADGRLAPDAALELVHSSNVRDTLEYFAPDGFARAGVVARPPRTPGLTLDPGREPRAGIGEVIFAEGKNNDLLFAALDGLSSHGPTLATRVSPAQGEALLTRFPEGFYWREARLFTLNPPERFIATHSRMSPLSAAAEWSREGEILVVSAGSSDMPVALEAFGSLVFLNCEAGLVSDAGVAGLHRLSPHVDALRRAKAVIAVAGMEGALPGVLAGLTRAPVVAVPTSVGYGVGSGGFAALSTMLCTCVPGVAVVNINNGFGAAAFAAKVLLSGGGRAKAASSTVE
ncbi:MAG: nickel pincer cofactor biosynthesis protein LarB [Desulfovibrio sp.]|nr:nickel pincer cofactor biosynthesis protein LarB [Desulfovibrio sp.]